MVLFCETPILESILQKLFYLDSETETLDEFPEFDRRVLEALRQPLEDNVVSVSRARGSAQFPANVTLIAAMNPCPCGNFNSQKTCVCAPSALERYRRKLSGPIIDRIDLWLNIDSVDHEKLSQKTRKGEISENIRSRVAKARSIQDKRFAEHKNLHTNSDMGARDIEKFISLEKKVEDLLQKSARQLDLSARSYHKVQKIARTIADIAGDKVVGEKHILEALQYRPKQLHAL